MLVVSIFIIILCKDRDLSSVKRWWKSNISFDDLRLMIVYGSPDHHCDVDVNAFFSSFVIFRFLGI